MISELHRYIWHCYLSNRCEGLCVCVCVCVCVYVLPWSSRHAFVPRSLTLSHLVHPRAAVKAVSSSHKPCGWIHLSSHVEACDGIEELRNNKRSSESYCRKWIYYSWFRDIKTTPLSTYNNVTCLVLTHTHTCTNTHTLPVLPSSLIFMSILGPAFLSLKEIPSRWRCRASWITSYRNCSCACAHTHIWLKWVCRIWTF